jgi:L-arabinose isomerase
VLFRSFDSLFGRLLRLQVQGHRHTVLAKLDTVGYVAGTLAFQHSMGIAQTNGVLTPVLNQRVGGRLGCRDIADAALFEAMQPVPEGTYTGQTNQHRLFNLDQGTILSTTP